MAIAWGLTVAFWLVKTSGFGFVIAMCALCSVWLCYAIGTEGNVLNNRFTHYISNISMEIYLCHMMCFRVVEMLHLEKCISRADIIYLLSCILTLILAITFSHIVKYKVLPKIEPYLFKN